MSPEEPEVNERSSLAGGSAERSAPRAGAGAEGATPSRTTPSERRRAAVNAVLGDYLEQQRSHLAIQMGLYHDGRPLRPVAPELHERGLDSSTRIAVFLHGLGQNEACWIYPGSPAKSYGSLLRAELGVTPFYVRYNTGRHISQNGRELAALLEQLAAALPAVDDITLLGHSLGGLVIRSACHYGALSGHRWVTRVHRAFYLGSPHLGSPLEQAGSLVSLVLGSIDNPVVRLIHDVTDLRGASIKDLCYGSLLDEDWDAGANASSSASRRPKVVPLPSGIEHYFVAGTLAKGASQDAAVVLLGDAVVSVPSATDPARRAGLPADHWALAAGVSHMHLSHSPVVYARIRAWFGAAPEPVAAEPEQASVGAAAPSAAPLDLERVDAYRALIQAGIEHGATAIQRVQEELSARPYDVLDRIPGLAKPARIVRALHFEGMRATYDVIRWVNRASGAILRAGMAQARARARPQRPPEER
jgi:hypothetical protein